MANTKTTFNYFNADKISVKFDGEESFSTAGCLASIERSVTVKTITKKCAGLTVRSDSRPTGLTLKIKVQDMPVAVYNKMFSLDKAKTGSAVALGMNKFAKFAVKFDAKDEDDDESYQLYPVMCPSKMPDLKIDNDADTIPEIEIDATASFDSTKHLYYEEQKASMEPSVTFEAWDPVTKF